METQDWSPGEIARLGDEIYERDLRSLLETDENIGKFVVIDVLTGGYEIDADHLTASRRARIRFPNGRRYALRVGYPAAGTVGGSLRRRQT